MSENQRNRDTKGFKLQIVRQLKDEQRTVPEVSRDHCLLFQGKINLSNLYPEDI
jgi:transposase-like protein